MKVEQLHVSHLRNDAHFQFFTDFKELVERFDATTLKIQPQFNTFLALYADEDTALKKIMKSALTAEIQEADKYRDGIWRGMLDTNKGALKHFSEPVRQAAGRLKIVFDTYGNVSVKPLDEETSALYNVLEDLKGKYAADAATVGLTAWMTELGKANAAFETLMRARYDEAALKTDLVLKEVRLKIDEAYRVITERINAAIIIEGETTYRDFVTTLNTVIKRYSDILAQRKGRAAAARAAGDAEQKLGTMPEEQASLSDSIELPKNN